MTRDAPIVVCGAGIAGVAAAYHLAALHGATHVTLVDPREPLTLTSRRSLEGYRASFPVPAMAAFMRRSIDLLEALVEDSGGSIRMNRRGYLYLTRDPGRLAALAGAAAAGGDPAAAVRRHPGPEPYVPADPEEWSDAPSGADRIDDPELVRRLWPFVTPDVAGALHVRRAGFHDAWGAGQWMLMRAVRAGVAVRRARVTAIDAPGGRVRGVTLDSGETLPAAHVVLAPGAELAAALRMLELEWPVYRERHVRLVLRDVQGALPREAPMLAWSDPVDPGGSEDGRAARAGDPAAAAWLRPMPGPIHVRPRERPREVLIAWTHDGAPHAPDAPPRDERHAGEALLRAAARAVPALEAYAGRAAEGIVEGADCLRMPDDLPLIGPLPVEGAWALGALSGYGVMGAQAAGDLLAAHLLGLPLPGSAAALLPSRDPGAALPQGPRP